MFFPFLAGIIRDFDRYLERGDVDFVRDGVGYRLAGMWLTTAEAKGVARALDEILAAATRNRPGRGRRRWYFGSIALPAPEE
jgi:hypothetical protein